MKNRKSIVIIMMLLIVLLSVNYASSANLDDDHKVAMQDSQINGTLQAGDGVKFYVDPTYEGEVTVVRIRLTRTFKPH